MIVLASNTTVSAIHKALADRKRNQLESQTRAAVNIILTPIYPHLTHVLLIERSRNPKDPWSGQMAFPGGRIEEDENALSAAYREAQEEVGLNLVDTAEFLGTCDDLRAMAGGKKLNLVITPFVFRLTQPVQSVKFSLQNEEVASILWAPLEAMQSGYLDCEHTVEHPHIGTRKLPCYRLDGKVIWGLTYMMLRNLFNIIK